MAESAEGICFSSGTDSITTNCLMPPKASYADRVFTTGAVVFPNTPFIASSTDGHKDFTPVIEKALELGGFSKDQHLPESTVVPA